MTAEQMINAGLCSVTLRGLPVDPIVDLVAKAGLTSVEWGGDVHVPLGDLAAAGRAAKATEEAGLRVASYGSYFRAGVHRLADFGPVLDCARTLGAPRIRIWAGDTSSMRTTRERRREVVETIQAAAGRAAAVDIELAVEYHSGTLADGSSSTEQLLDEVDRPNVFTYWRSPIGATKERAFRSLERLLPKVAAVHVFTGHPGQARCPMSEYAELWAGVVDRLGTEGRPVDVFLEFVPNNDAAALRRESSNLREMAERSRKRARKFALSTSPKARHSA